MSSPAWARAGFRSRLRRIKSGKPSGGGPVPAGMASGAAGRGGGAAAASPWVRTSNNKSEWQEPMRHSREWVMRSHRLSFRP